MSSIIPSCLTVAGLEAQRDIQAKATCDLADAGLEGQLRPSFYLTSIYDHSIFEVSMTRCSMYHISCVGIQSCGSETHPSVTNTRKPLEYLSIGKFMLSFI